jgi:hypothetical protein
MVSGGEISTVISGIAAMLVVVIPALAKRRDVTISQLEKLVKKQGQRLDAAEAEIESLRSQLVKYEADNFNLRRTLAANGIPVPPEVTP